MHDLRYANEIVAALKRKIKSKNAEEAKNMAIVVRVSLGSFSHVKPEALKETLSLIADKEGYENVKLEVVTKNFTMTCRKCAKSSSGHHPVLACPHCGSSDFDVEMGEEFTVDSIEVSEADKKIR